MASFKATGFTFYNVTFPTKNRCMQELDIANYTVLKQLIARELEGFPLAENYLKRLNACKKRYGKHREGEMRRKRYFARKLEQEGFWRGE